MSSGEFQPRTVSGSRVFGRYKSKGNFENVVTIDGDKGDIDVVIIDAPETSQQGSRWSQRTWRDVSPSDVISIDDEDEEIGDNPTTACHSATGRSSYDSGSTFLSEELDHDGQAFVTGKSMQQSMMQPKHGYPRNRYGLDYVSDNQSYGSNSAESGTSEVENSDCDSSDCDSSDCEIMDDKSGEIREQWERAALRKRMSEKVQFSFEDWASFSRSSADPGSQSDEIKTDMCDVEKCLNKIYSQNFKEANAQCSPSNTDDVENDISSGAPDADEFTCEIPFGGMSNGTTSNLDPAAGVVHEGHAFGKEGLISKECSGGSEFSDRNQFNYKTACSFEPANKPYEDARGHNSFSLDKDELGNSGSSFYTAKVRDESSFIYKGKSYPGRPYPVWKGKEHFNGSVSSQKIEQAQPPHNYVVNHKVAVQEKDKSFDEENTQSNNRPTDERQYNHLNSCFHNFKEGILEEPPGNHCAGKATERSCSFTADPEDESQVRNDLIGEHEKNKKLTINKNISEVQNDLIADREKHKESIEYKHAEEEEWASRKQQLQIQAEEAQRLRRRRKAEIMRLVDMEKRQKQRLEEIRESQKKDQETINLKEQLRVEIRKELEKMEGRYRDMASLLRGLGIHIEGGLCPSLHEVSAAYKQALRRFHPDRVCRTDIHQQVKAEETFKFISRLKEELLPLA